MREHELLDGQVLRLDDLPACDLEYLDRLAAEAKTGADYFNLLRQVKGPGAVPMKGDFITPAVAGSVLFRVAHDVADRVGIEQGYVLDPSVDRSVIKPSPDLRSLTEVARLVGITRAAVHQALVEGRLVGQRVGNAWVVRQQDAQKFRDGRTARSDKSLDVSDRGPRHERKAGPSSKSLDVRMRDKSAHIRPGREGVRVRKDHTPDFTTFVRSESSREAVFMMKETPLDEAIRKVRKKKA